MVVMAVTMEKAEDLRAEEAMGSTELDGLRSLGGYWEVLLQLTLY